MAANLHFRANLSNHRVGRTLVLVACLIASGVSARDLISGTNSTWKYAEASSVPSGWVQIQFDDSDWKSGQAPLGYGTERLQSTIRNEADTAPKPITTRFRREFDAPGLKEKEACALMFCVDDGAVVYINGREVARVNLPKGPIESDTPAKRDLTGKQEGYYYRVPLPAGLIRAQHNVLAFEVHQASANNTDLFFDAVLKTVPPKFAMPAITPVVRDVVSTFHQKHYLGPTIIIPNGYYDGGRHMAVDAKGQVSSGREILLVDRARDTELAKQIAYAQSPEVKSLEPLKRVERLAAYIDRASTPPGGERWVGPANETLTEEFANRPLLLGDVLDQCQAGVCRHRSLLFKLLADAAGLKTALVRGNFLMPDSKGTNGFPHAWNEVFLTGGQRVLVDVMHNGGKAVFRETTDAYVVKHYLRENDTPWY